MRDDSDACHRAKRSGGSTHGNLAPNTSIAPVVTACPQPPVIQCCSARVRTRPQPQSPHRSPTTYCHRRLDGAAVALLYHIRMPGGEPLLAVTFLCATSKDESRTLAQHPSTVAAGESRGYTRASSACRPALLRATHDAERDGSVSHSQPRAIARILEASTTRRLFGLPPLRPSVG